MAVIHVGRYSIEISHPDKILFPDDGLTKMDIIKYYRQASTLMIPHLKNRPVTLRRFPDGIDGQGFYQHRAADYMPKWIERKRLESREGEEIGHILCANVASLVSLANLASITLHMWQSRIDAADHPDRMLFDLDPPNTDFKIVRNAARSLKELLKELGLSCFVMSTGSRGLHVVVPILRRYRFDAVRAFAQDVAKLLEKGHSDEMTTEQRKKQRGSKLYVDTSHNAYGQTAVAPYAVRARTSAPVAAPLHWHEFDDSDLHARSYTLQNIFRKFGRKNDPWKGIGKFAKSLEKPRRILDDLLSHQV